MEITAASGPSFFIRPSYLTTVSAPLLVPGYELDGEQELELLDAALVFAAEKKAVDYLSRQEQSRSGLVKKLMAKGMEKRHIDVALNYLEGKNYLSDSRFARSWLNNRRITKCEGRSRLLSELMSRGIDKNICDQALDEFFAENDESELCRKAALKLIRLGKKEEKLVASLVRSGFTYKMIKSVLGDITDIGEKK